MFEKEIENVKQKILSLAHNEETISFSEIISWNIPQAVKDYFSIYAEKILNEEIFNLLYSKRFDQNSIDFVSVRKKFISTLKNALLFYRSEFEQIVDQATKFAINFILRPEWTLAKIVFKDESLKTKEQIIDTLLCLKEYGYYKELIIKLLERLQSTEVKIDLFERILRRIDEEIVKNASIKNVVSIAEPIFEFFKFANNSSVVPTEALLIFYTDKGMEKIVKEIELEKDLHGRTKFTIADLEIVLKRTLKQPPEEQFSAPMEVITIENESKVSKPEPQIEAIDEKITQRSDPKLQNLNLLLNEKDKEKFIRKIFRRDREKFFEIINKLNSTNTWKEASSIIESIFAEYEIDPYSNEAVEFTDLIYKRYFPET